MDTFFARSRCYFAQYRIMAPVAVVLGGQSRVRSVTPPESSPPDGSSGGVEQGFQQALTAREGHQSRTLQRLP